MVNFKIWTRFWKKTLPVHTYTVLNLFVTRSPPEISRRTSDIMYIPLKIRLFYHLLCFCYYRFMASCLQNPALMKCKCTKTAAPKTPSVACKTKLYFRQSRYTTVFLIHRVICPHIRQCIHIIHFKLCKRSCRRILHHIKMVVILFHKSARRNRVCITILYIKTFCILKLIILHCLKIRQRFCIINTIQIFGSVNSSVYKSNIRHINPAFKSICYLDN